MNPDRTPKTRLPFPTCIPSVYTTDRVHTVGSPPAVSPDSIDSHAAARLSRQPNIPTPLSSSRQHLSYSDCLEVKREYYQNSSVLDCVTQYSQSAARLYEQSLHVRRLGLSHWDPYTVCRGGCLELYYCNMVEWFWWESSLILTTNWFPSVL